MGTSPDLVTTSGREDMTMGDRMGLLAWNRVWLEVQPGNGAVVHDRAQLLEIMTLLDHCHTKSSLQYVLAREISSVECLVMAWRRGGHTEYRRILTMQRDGRCR